ncbi:MAG: insulinase family protein [Clostridiales bacterium]|uniref:M16 family metallopeptidase n=1 Tax=Clostridium sp. N3C TaxID=1776758 RepID=UPI00092DEB29|nr:pitrilysin family protein [Clostridium sp. N3C]NLZ48716.1 insulinase family protein [Clostridiales bacterium]SCN21261.1 protease3 [Clostridium sp. N3C]
MKIYILDNGIKLFYQYREGTITSFCIGFKAGALEEEGYHIGTAHVVEHMLFKGTSKRSEKEINSEMDKIFGFNNAMTNYPYVIYYGSVNSMDFVDAFDIYSDIILNPTFPRDGFQEEMKVIKEELRDWKEDLSQSCEDNLFANAFRHRRIKDLIIGTEENLEKITLEEVKRFYQEHYFPGNCVITIVTSLDGDYIYNVVNQIFGNWKREARPLTKIQYEKNNMGTFVDFADMEGAKIQYIYPIDQLSRRELIALKYINVLFGEGTSSILYDEIRTERALAYEVFSNIKYERGIELFSINISTSKKKIEEAMKAVEFCIYKLKNYNWMEKENIENIKKRLILKEGLAFERSIEYCKRITVDQLMFDDYGYILESYNNFNISHEDISKTINKVFVNPTIQILCADEGEK